jgi:hypothetical protein
MEKLDLIIDDLFGDGLESKMNFLEDRKSSKAIDGLYKADISRLSDPSRPYRAKIRFLPNLREDGLAQSAIERISHFIRIQNNPELSGTFDSPVNFQEPCRLSKLYFELDNSKNSIMKEKAKLLKFSKKYYSYVLIMEDEQQPELVGKIMVFQYGKQIYDKIKSERMGEITGNKSNVFQLNKGKDFILLVSSREVMLDGKKVRQPNYDKSTFAFEETPISLYVPEKGFKQVPLDEKGEIHQNVRQKVQEFLLNREVTLENFSPKRLTPEDNTKIDNIIAYLTGKYTSSNSLPSSDDFVFDVASEDSVSNPTTSHIEDEEDFFADL